MEMSTRDSDPPTAGQFIVGFVHDCYPAPAIANGIGQSGDSVDFQKKKTQKKVFE